MRHDNETLKILQYNTRKSREVMAELFRRDQIYDQDIIAIQEPYRNPLQNTSHHPARDRFHLLYFDSKLTRTCLFVNKRIAPSTWSVEYINEDICLLRLTTRQDRVCLYNVYNEPGEEDPTRTLRLLSRELSAADPADHLVVLGDFNLHHPQWSDVWTRSPSREASVLLDMLIQYHLWQVTPPGMKTHRCQSSDTTIDLTFCTSALHQRLIRCKVADDLDCDSDHLPISIWLSWQWNHSTAQRSRKWQSTDTDRLRSAVQRELHRAEPLDWDTPQALDDQVEHLVHSLTTGVNDSTPWKNPSAYSVPGFDEECKKACAETQRLRRKWQSTRSEQDWRAYTQARNAKGRLIRRLLQDTHRQNITDAASTPHGIWKLAKWATRRQAGPVASITPALRKQDGSLEAGAEGKVNLLRSAFFPPPVQADLSDTLGYDYPTPCSCPPITDSEVLRAVNRSSPNKAPGPDGIINGILQKVLDLILPKLVRLFNASWNMGYFPRHFKQSITVVLRKAGKEDDSQPKAYRPIALLNTIGKVMEAVIGNRLMWLAEKFELLPASHIGGRKMTSTEDAIHSLLAQIHKAWDQKQVASLLLLDVSGAFDNVSHPRLLHNLRKRRIDPVTIKWISSFLSDRTTAVVLPEFAGRAESVFTGVPQGSPLSLTLYLFYNADLLEQCANDKVNTLGYIDDVSLLAVGATPQHNTQALKVAHRKAQSWAKKHGSVFGVSKYTLVHFARSPWANTKHPLRLPDITIVPETSCRYLGLQIDNRLEWTDHIQRVSQTATRRLTALSALASSSWGANLTTLRLVYRAMILPQLLYGCSAWYKIRTHRRAGHAHKQQSQAVRQLAPIQRRAAQIITGAFRTTATSAVEIEAHLLPLDQLMEQMSLHAALRLAINRTHCSVQVNEDWRGARMPPLTLHTKLLKKRYGIGPGTLEYRIPYLVTPWWQPPKVYIDNTPEDGIAQHATIRAKADTTCVYTDGSCVNGNVGAAAVILSDPNSGASAVMHERSLHLGSDTQSNVYVAELNGILLALEVIRTELQTCNKKATIFSDNQGALKALREPSNTSGQSVLVKILQVWDDIRVQGSKVDFRWIPAHRGIPGSDAADAAAKRATSVPPDHAAHQDKMTLLTTAKKRINTDIHQDWEYVWSHAKHGHSLRSLGRKPDKANLTLHRNLPRAISSIISQMRTGKIGLRAYLYGIDRTETKQCTCNQGIQDVEHILLRCRDWIAEREEMWAGGKPMLNLKNILNDHKMVVRAAQMMMKTGLLTQFHAAADSIGIIRRRSDDG